MALIKCPECGKEISDKAEVCIQCGYPLKCFLEEKKIIEDQDGEKNFIHNSEELNNKTDDRYIIEKKPSVKKSKKFLIILIIVLGLIIIGIVGFFSRESEKNMEEEDIIQEMEVIEENEASEANNMANIEIQKEIEKVLLYKQGTYSCEEGCKAIIDICYQQCYDVVDYDKYENEQIAAFYPYYLDVLQYIIENTEFEFEYDLSRMHEHISAEKQCLADAKYDYEQEGIANVVDSISYLTDSSNSVWEELIAPIIFHAYKSEWNKGVELYIEEIKAYAEKKDAVGSYEALVNDLTVLGIVSEYEQQLTELAKYIDQRDYESAKVVETKEPPAIGMTESQVKASSWGRPGDINKTTTEYGESQQWVYGGGRYVYFEDGIVTAIQE